MLEFVDSHANIARCLAKSHCLHRRIFAGRALSRSALSCTRPTDEVLTSQQVALSCTAILQHRQGASRTEWRELSRLAVHLHWELELRLHCNAAASAVTLAAMSRCS
eukprot:7155-Heterococcus_DN1.PRE.3